MKALVLSSSPRRDGNSAMLAQAVRDGLVEAGHEAEFVYASDFLNSFLRDCRQCRLADGECAIGDGFRSVFLKSYLPAQGFIAATPIYWYGVSAQLKAFFDRAFCYYAASYPRSCRRYRRHEEQAHRSGSKFGRDLSHGLRWHHQPNPGVFPLYAVDFCRCGPRIRQFTWRRGPRSCRSGRLRAEFWPGILHPARD